MTREEHLKWCKERAIKEMDYTHDPKQGIISMMSDLRKHPETDNPALSALCVMMLAAGKLESRQEVIDFIDGFR